LGYATDTGDVTGARLNDESHAKSQSIHREQIEAAMASLRGEIEQTPPMYSAKKVAGRKLYELAREGEQVEREPIKVTVSKFEPLSTAEPVSDRLEEGTLDLAARVVCSAGTYVRTLAEDFGKLLGTGAHLAELRRTRAGRFAIDDAVTLDKLSELAQSRSISDVLISPDESLSHLPAVQLSKEDAARTIHGIDLEVHDAQAANWTHDQAVRLRRESRELIAVGLYDHSRRRIHPTVVIGHST
jgi:tRNA pseudouridine55 synthase